ncbi:hypothetical protein IscW_ISCW007047 [Ixodes scapularis]|uniref:Uncharacterized protein n=1 Tax=Ixodes scapularis TaxID=6945 RepID=B7PW57_IXOSC|nr:hypothetical protein IscW_ISCW007047 [Ixodes scapularis]|eukprot:XP_002409315.1 hypothetical protein IscW_ISCW007047 [Ixodes scapularis]
MQRRKHRNTAQTLPLSVQEVDFSLGGLSVFYLRYMFVDFVYPFIVDVFAFVTKTPTRKPLTQAILYPFQRPVWAGLAISLVMAWAGLHLLRRWTPREQLVGSEPGIWFLLAALVRQSKSDTAETRAHRDPTKSQSH